MANQLSDAAREQILAALAKGQKIEAIKVYREATKTGLKESKEFIEDLLTQLRESDPDKYPEAKGCLGSVLLLAGTLAALTQLV